MLEKVFGRMGAVLAGAAGLKSHLQIGLMASVGGSRVLTSPVGIERRYVDAGEVERTLNRRRSAQRMPG